jgi:hypothetical protein
MDAKTRAMLNDAEQELLRETTRAKLAKLDEDELIDLHTRVRRARTKYVRLHRRRGAQQVASDRSRHRAAASTHRTTVKAEAFEDALAAVSSQLAKVAAKSAEALKRERLAAASTARPARGRQKPTPRSGKVEGGASPRARTREPVEKKRAASERARKQRVEARRAAR